MPIQSLNIGKYNRIPDSEDVTPLDRSIQKKEQRNWKIISVFGGILIILAILYFFYQRNEVLNDVKIYQTSMIGDRLTEITPNLMASQGFPVNTLTFGNIKCKASIPHLQDCKPNGNPSIIQIKASIKYQEILGFGGAFTEASAHNFFKLPENIQEKVIALYFGEKGIGYSLGRIHINSCDFSLQSYSFDEIENDFDLKYFDNDVTHDRVEMIPFIKLAQSSSKHPIRLLASPWSPPSWMKYPQYVPSSDPTISNSSSSSSPPPLVPLQSMTGSATPSGLKHDPRVRTAWAKYLTQFISAYANQGVSIWALTPQNEPEFPAPWEACSYNASDERSFVDHYLGPILKAQHPQVKLLAFDHNKDHLRAWTLAMMNEKENENENENDGNIEYVDGMAFHWYTGGGDRVLDGTYGYENVNFSYHYRPDKILLASEGCSCPGVKVDDWLRAERLAHDIIFDLHNYAQGWIDWNLLVDFQGGPNHLDNMCDAPMIASQDFSDIHLQPKYYYMGHISKFVPPGSVRIQSLVVGDYAFSPVDPNVRAGMETALFHCEKSTRQQWILNHTTNALQLKHEALDSESEEGYQVSLCVSKGDTNRPYLKIVVCEESQHVPLTTLSLSINERSQLVDLQSQECVTISGDVREPGALLTLAPCSTPPPASSTTSSSSSLNEAQFFQYDSQTGQMTTPYVQGLCLTAGWPFLTGISFLQNPPSASSPPSSHSSSSSSSIATILLNEANVGVDVLLSDEKKGIMNFYTPPKSIQTILY